MIIPTPDQKKAALIVVIDLKYKSSLAKCSRIRMVDLAMREPGIFHSVFFTRFDKRLWVVWQDCPCNSKASAKLLTLQNNPLYC